MHIEPTPRQATIEKLYGHLSTALDNQNYDQAEQIARCLQLLDTKHTHHTATTNNNTRNIT